MGLVIEAREGGEEKVLLFNLCGHGYFDLAAYEHYMAGELPDSEHPDDEMERVVSRVPG